MQLTGTKRSCESEVCGACTVLVDNRAMSSCNYLAFEANEKTVLTIEGVAQDGKLDPLQEAFIRNIGAQCGYCTPGQIMAAKALLMENPNPSREQIAEWLSGNICRCGAYGAIAQSILEAAQEKSGEKGKTVEVRGQKSERVSSQRSGVSKSEEKKIMTTKITRRAFCSMLLALPFPARAQQPTKIPRIGYLTGQSLSSNAARFEAFRQGLRELGYVEGKNIIIEYRSAEGKLDRLPALAAELVRLKVDIIVTAGSTPTRAAKEATSTIPIVMAQDWRSCWKRVRRQSGAIRAGILLDCQPLPRS